MNELYVYTSFAMKQSECSVFIMVLISYHQSNV